MTLIRFYSGFSKTEKDWLCNISTNYIPSLGDRITLHRDEEEEKLYKIVEITHSFKDGGHICDIVMNKLRSKE